MSCIEVTEERERERERERRSELVSLELST